MCSYLTAHRRYNIGLTSYATVLDSFQVSWSCWNSNRVHIVECVRPIHWNKFNRYFQILYLWVLLQNVLSWNFQENYPLFKWPLIKWYKLNIKILYLFILIKNQNIKYLTNGEQNKPWQLIMNINTNAYLYLQIYRWCLMCDDILKRRHKKIRAAILKLDF